MFGNVDGMPASEAVGQIDPVEAVIYYFEQEQVGSFLVLNVSGGSIAWFQTGSEHHSARFES